MRPVAEITEEHLAYWREFPQRDARVFGGPPSEPDCTPCPAVVTVSVGDNGKQTPIVRVPFEMSDVERDQIARGGRVWPIHMVEVEGPVSEEAVVDYTALRLVVTAALGHLMAGTPGEARLALAEACRRIGAKVDIEVPAL